jgi:hypothetical protein
LQYASPAKSLQSVLTVWFVVCLVGVNILDGVVFSVESAFNIEVFVDVVKSPISKSYS